MKFIDKEVGVNGDYKYKFWIGKEEIITLKQIVNHYKNNIPRTPETIPLVGRVREFAKRLSEVKF